MLTAFLAFGVRGSSQTAVLPKPNGYDDFAAAVSGLVRWSGEFLALSPEDLRSVVSQNSKVLATVRDGLKKQSAVPVINDMNWFNTHMVQLGPHRSIAQLLVADGLVHLQEGRTNEAVRCFADCVAFAHAAHRQGLRIDDLVGIACQSIGVRHLVQAAPHVSPNTLRAILPELIALDQAREPASAIIQRNRKWSRGVYGPLSSIWGRIVAHKSLHAAEEHFEKRHAYSVAALRLVMTELAVQGYIAQEGKPPTSLAQLVPA